MARVGTRVPLRSVTWPQLPAEWATTVLPNEVPHLTEAIVTAIRAEIPEYRRALDGPYGQQTRRGVEEALKTFMREVVRRNSPTSLDEVFRVLGRVEAAEGRPHDVLLSACRVGGLVAMMRVGELMERNPLPAETAVALASAVMAFIDRLAALSAQGYEQAQQAPVSQTDRLRARLGKMVLDQPATPLEAIRGLAARAGWNLPDQVQIVDARGDAFHEVRAQLGDDALTGGEADTPVFVVPAPVSPEVVAGLTQLGGAVRVTIGSAVDLIDAPRSLRWSLLCSDLRDRGLLPDHVVTVCDDHLATLLAMSNPQLVDLLCRRRLQPLLELTWPKRVKLARLLAAWLELGASKAEVAESLGLHRQTAEYQFGQLTRLFGVELHNREARVEMVWALRGVLPHWELEAAEGFPRRV